MSNNEVYEIPDGYYYTGDHEWLKSKPEGTVLVGITDYAAKMLNDIVYVSLPQKGQKFQKKDVFGQVESVKTVSDIYMPVTGTVLRLNEELTNKPELVANSPYENGWMLEVTPLDFVADSKDLLDSNSYREYIQNLAKGTH